MLQFGDELNRINRVYLSIDKLKIGRTVELKIN